MHKRVGSLEVFTGTMFSGKTTALIGGLNRSLIAKKKVLLFKPKLDDRYSDTEVYTHHGIKMEAICLSKITDILNHITNGDSDTVIGIDEIQFFDTDECMAVMNILLDTLNLKVLVAGLDMDYKGRPFGPVPNLMAICDKVTKFKAVCMDCGNDSMFEYRINDSDSLVELGSSDKYISLCRHCRNKRLGGK